MYTCVVCFIPSSFVTAACGLTFNLGIERLATKLVTLSSSVQLRIVWLITKSTLAHPFLTASHRSLWHATNEQQFADPFSIRCPTSKHATVHNCIQPSQNNARLITTTEWSVSITVAIVCRRHMRARTSNGRAQATCNCGTNDMLQAVGYSKSQTGINSNLKKVCLARGGFKKPWTHPRSALQTMTKLFASLLYLHAVTTVVYHI